MEPQYNLMDKTGDAYDGPDTEDEAEAEADEEEADEAGGETGAEPVPGFGLRGGGRAVLEPAAGGGRGEVRAELRVPQGAAAAPRIFYDTAVTIATSLHRQITVKRATIAAMFAQCRSGKTGAILYTMLLCYKHKAFKHFQIFMTTSRKDPEKDWTRAMEQHYDVEDANRDVFETVTAEFNHFLRSFASGELSPDGKPFVNGWEFSTSAGYSDIDDQRDIMRVFDEADYGDGADQLSYKVLDKLGLVLDKLGLARERNACTLYVSATQPTIADVIMRDRGNTAFVFHTPPRGTKRCGYVGNADYLEHGKIRAIPVPLHNPRNPRSAEDESNEHAVLYRALRAHCMRGGQFLRKYVLIRLSRHDIIGERVMEEARSMGIDVVRYYDDIATGELQGEGVDRSLFAHVPERMTAVFVKAKLSRGEEIPVKNHIAMYWCETSADHASWRTAIQYSARLYGYKSDSNDCLRRGPRRCRSFT